MCSSFPLDSTWLAIWLYVIYGMGDIQSFNEPKITSTAHPAHNTSLHSLFHLFQLSYNLIYYSRLRQHWVTTHWPPTNNTLAIQLWIAINTELNYNFSTITMNSFISIFCSNSSISDRVRRQRKCRRPSSVQLSPSLRCRSCVHCQLECMQR